jgi:hypothetical protein
VHDPLLKVAFPVLSFRLVGKPSRLAWGVNVRRPYRSVIKLAESARLYPVAAMVIVTSPLQSLRPKNANKKRTLASIA